jgi:hypothetical protein
MRDEHVTAADRPTAAGKTQDAAMSALRTKAPVVRLLVGRTHDIGTETPISHATLVPLSGTGSAGSLGIPAASAREQAPMTAAQQVG